MKASVEWSEQGPGTEEVTPARELKIASGKMRDGSVPPVALIVDKRCWLIESRADLEKVIAMMRLEADVAWPRGAA